MHKRAGDPEAAAYVGAITPWALRNLSLCSNFALCIFMIPATGNFPQCDALRRGGCSLLVCEEDVHGLGLASRAARADWIALAGRRGRRLPRERGAALRRTFPHLRRCLGLGVKRRSRDALPPRPRAPQVAAAPGATAERRLNPLTTVLPDTTCGETTTFVSPMPDIEAPKGVSEDSASCEVLGEDRYLTTPHARPLVLARARAQGACRSCSCSSSSRRQIVCIGWLPVYLSMLRALSTQSPDLERRPPSGTSTTSRVSWGRRADREGDFDWMHGWVELRRERRWDASRNSELGNRTKSLTYADWTENNGLYSLVSDSDNIPSGGNSSSNYAPSPRSGPLATRSPRSPPPLAVSRTTTASDGARQQP
ncbi:hypothetical protein B0H15DRAFT_1000843 [Mycena belliarum]|uniref:Uncharacterized protein n=1 Tax=Mycena belliarum TaxID=1033014 RepID=A0AAD6XPH9_9AGAR|nr:hypothetical protein B0H15DRAFT_1000843 [Mycena belliae]